MLRTGPPYRTSVPDLRIERPHRTSKKTETTETTYVEVGDGEMTALGSSACARVSEFPSNVVPLAMRCGCRRCPTCSDSGVGEIALTPSGRMRIRLCPDEAHDDCTARELLIDAREMLIAAGFDVIGGADR